MRCGLGIARCFRISLVAGLLTLCAGTGISFACDPELLARPAAVSPYSVWENGRYCEGFYVAAVGAPFELVSLTLGEVKFQLTDRFVSVEVPGWGSSPIVTLRVLSTTRGVHYRLDAQVSTGQVFSWPTSNVLAKRKLSASEIGAFAISKHQEVKVLVPVAFLGAPPSRSSVSEQAIVVLRVPVATDWVRYRVRRSGSEVAGPNPWKDLEREPLDAGALVSISLARGREELAVRLEVRAKQQGEAAHLNFDEMIILPRLAN